MKRFLMGSALAVAAITLATMAQAAGPKGSSGGRGNPGSHNSRGHVESHDKRGHDGSHDSHYGSHDGRGSREGYHNLYGKKFSYGHYYYGRNHNQWTYRYFWSFYGCDCYWCPDACCWYYWCEPRCSYLPVSCITFAPPTPAAPVAAAAAAAAAASSSTVAPTVVGPTIVTNTFGSSQPSVPPGPPMDLPPVVQTSGPTASNTAIGNVGTVQPIGSPGSVPAPPRP